MVHIITIVIGIVQVIRTIEWVYSFIFLVPSAGIPSLPTVREAVPVRVYVVRIGLDPGFC